MRLSDINRVVANIKFLPVYTCGCGFRQQGDTMHIEVDTTDASRLATVFDNIRLSSHSMPIGWASFYSPSGDKLICPKCLYKEPSNDTA